MSRAILIMVALRAEKRRQCIIKTKRRRRNLRNGLLRGALELSEAEFSAHYRLTKKKMFMNLCNELRPQFIRSRRRTKVSIECKVLVALSFYATGSYQKPVGMSYLHGLSQARVSNAVREVTQALNHVNILQKYIRFPQTQEGRRAIIHGFYTNFGIPGVLGCIDGTHVALAKPTYFEQRFFNRKHYYSRNVQIMPQKREHTTSLGSWVVEILEDAIQTLQNGGILVFKMAKEIGIPYSTLKKI